MQCTGLSNQQITQNQLGWKRPLRRHGCSPSKKHTSSAIVEKAEKVRPGNGLNVCKSALHSVRKDSSCKHRIRNLSPSWNNTQEGNAGFQTLPVLRLTSKDWSTSQLHTVTVPPSAHQEVICRKLCKVFMRKPLTCP